jgi:peptide/nickel transport system substrate-binding protein
VKSTLSRLFNLRFRINVIEPIEKALHSFTFGEKLVFYGMAVICGISMLVMLLSVNSSFVVQVPARGGTLTEGIIGTPRFINPILAMSDADRDLTTLIYSGLLKALPDGTLTPDLASEYTISDDGSVYTFKLKNGAIFHDGELVTADDIIFTIEKAQDPLIKSPRRANWEDVAVKKIDENTISFTMPHNQPYAPFLENMTMGILPKHIWNDAKSDEMQFSQFNTEPIGSGPYMVSKVNRNKSSIPISYELVPFNHYTLGAPYIAHLIIQIYSGSSAIEQALARGEIESTNVIASDSITQIENIKDIQIIKTPEPRVFGIFFNQTESPVLANKEVRTALAMAIDKDRIVREVLGGFGTRLDGPIPPESFVPSVPKVESKATSTDAIIAQARIVLEKNGWKFSSTTNMYEKKVKKEIQKLEFSISTANTPDFKGASEIIKENWTKLGAKIDIKSFDSSSLQQTVIKPRAYDALFFGEILGRELDLFAFWHSSQRLAPGLNIALYTNSLADKALEGTRRITDPEIRLNKYDDFINEITKDVPAVFIYTPDFLYAMNNKVNGVEIGHITTPADRFANIHKWYISTDSVWKIFVKDTMIIGNIN